MIIETDTHTWEFPSLDAAVNFVTNESPMHVSVFGNIDAAKREPLRAAFEAAMRARSDDAGVRFDAPVRGGDRAPELTANAGTACLWTSSLRGDRRILVKSRSLRSLGGVFPRLGDTGILRCTG